MTVARRSVGSNPTPAAQPLSSGDRADLLVENGFSEIQARGKAYANGSASAGITFDSDTRQIQIVV